MDDAPETAADDGDGAGSANVEGGYGTSGEQDSPSTTLVEVIPGVALLFGEVPDGIELVDLNLFHSFDQVQLSKVLGSLGNTGTVVGNVSEGVASAQGLYRVNDATLTLLKSGGQMAAKDGAKLGAILKNGKVVAQARFVPVSMTAATAIAAIGPAIAMVGLQMQLGEISGLVSANIALTTQTLKSIRHEQWSELEGLAEAVDKAVYEVGELGAITDSVWEPIAQSEANIRKQQKNYRKNVAGHIQELGKLEGRARRQYLEAHAEAIIFDTHALLRSLKTYAEYQALRAALARKRSINDEDEARLFDLITRDTPPEIEKLLREIDQLTGSLVRELRIISELPGRASSALSKKRKDAVAVKLTCAQLLEAIEPLANMLYPATEVFADPETVCAPEALDLDPYVNILRWFLEDGEILRGVAFPYEVGTHNFAGIVPWLLDQRVDATWDALTKRGGRIVEKLASSKFIAVTDRRIITANPTSLLRMGELGPIYSLDDVRYVRRPSHGESSRLTIDVTTESRDIHWIFPGAADHEDVDSLANMLSEKTPREATTSPPIEKLDKQSDTIES